MATVVEKTGIRRAKGWLYFLDKRGDVSRARMARGGGKGPKEREKVTAYADALGISGDDYAAIESALTAWFQGGDFGPLFS